MADTIHFISGYSEVNGLRMYYEIYGQGKPLVLIHGGGSTIQSSFGRIIPLLAKNRQLIGVELQAHGRTADRNSPLSFEQDADDVAQLLKNLQIPRADILGFSNGAQTAIEIVLRHPYLVNKIILAGTFYKRSGTFPQFWEMMDNAEFKDMPQAFKDEFLKLTNNPEGLLTMFNRDVQRMQTFKGWSDEQLKAIKAHALVISGDSDVGTAEHAVEMYRAIPNSQLAIIPGGHGKLLGEITSLSNGQWAQSYVTHLIEEFLD